MTVLRGLRLALLLSLFCLPGHKVVAAAPAYPGSTIESAAEFFAAARAGLQPEDSITGWAYSDSPDEVFALDGPFRLRLLEREVHAIRPVTLHGLRDGEAIAIAPENGRWRLGANPDWAPELLAQLKSARELVSTDFAQSDAVALALVETLVSQADVEGAAWVWYSLAGEHSKSADWANAESAYLKAIELLSAAPDSESRFAAQKGMLLYYLAGVQSRQNRFADAISTNERAIAAESILGAKRLAIAANKVAIAQIVRRQSDFPKAQALFDEALELQQSLAPDGLVVATTLVNAARVQVQTGEMEAAAALYERAYSIAMQKDPNGVAAAGHLNGLGIVSYLTGNMALAEEQWTRSLQMKQRMEPGSANVATALHNVGLVNRARGDLREAENYYRQALEIAQKTEPNSLGTARTLNNLGTLALEQGDVRNAEYYHQQAFELRESVVPDSEDLAVSLINLGNVARESGQLEKAIRLHQQALDIQLRIAPESTEHARILANLGSMARKQGLLSQSLDYLEDALRIETAIAPKSTIVAGIRTLFGEALIEDSQYEAAERVFSEAHQILQDIAPRTFRAARVWHGLARVSVHAGQTELAIERFDKALLALESQQLKLGGSEESRVRAKSRYDKIYQDYIEFLLTLGNEETAFEILEQSRARELSNMLAERDLVFAEDIPEELELQRRTLAHRYESKQAQLYSARDDDKKKSLRTELLEIQREQDAVRRAIRDTAPGLAELQYPTRRSIEEYRNAASTGTAIISFSTTEAGTTAFLIDANGKLSVTKLQATEDELADDVKRFRFLMDAGRWDEQPSEILLGLGQTLYQKLFGPLEARLQDADVLLIVPDGPLNVLPFAALRRTSGDNTHYLAEWKPSLIVNSLSIYSQLDQQASNSSRPKTSNLIAFGNPDYREGLDVGVGGIRRDGYNPAELEALPWTATEVRNIAAAYPGANTVYVGDEATEERAKAVPKDTQYLHFATHATLNEWHPLDTAIVLSVPPETESTRDNGYLHVWEIYENLRLDAELVTLSACETALGSDIPGEGLIGLTRAFHYAGASTVLASLWRVDDRSTSDLMTHFYSQATGAGSLALALQAAQLKMIRGEPPTPPSVLQRFRRWTGLEDDPVVARHHPYHWAGFALNGRADSKR